MKVPVPISERSAPAKSQPIPVPPPEPGPRRSPERDYEPRYVALPRHRERGHGRRNLIGGVILLGLAVLLLAWAIYLAGSAAFLTIAACLATATLLHVMARSRLFRQRNGSFVAWAGVSLLAVMLVILHHGWLFMAGDSHSGAKAPVPAEKISTDTPLLRDAFPVQLDTTGGPMVRIKKDTVVKVAGHAYLAKLGDVYPLVDTIDGEPHVLVDGHEVTIPADAGAIAATVGNAGPDSKAAAELKVVPPEVAAAEFAPPKDIPFAEQVDASKREAVRRYPALKDINSPQNQLFLSAVKEQRHTGETEFFDNPNWPVMLAELCAAKDGWVRADPAADDPAPPRAEPVAPRATQVAPRKK